MSLVDEIAGHLVTNSVGGLPGSTEAWIITYRDLHSTTDQNIAVVQTGGLQQENINDADIDRPSFQLLFRAGKNSSTGLEAKVDSTIAVLDKQTVALSNKNYVDIQKSGDTQWLGYDENNRPLYSVNWQVIKERSS